MDMDRILCEVIRHVQAITETEAEIPPELKLCGELGMTSMELAQLAYELEEQYDIEIPDAAFKSDMTARDFAEIIEPALRGVK